MGVVDTVVPAEVREVALLRQQELAVEDHCLQTPLQEELECSPGTCRERMSARKHAFDVRAPLGWDPMPQSVQQHWQCIASGRVPARWSAQADLVQHEQGSTRMQPRCQHVTLAQPASAPAPPHKRARLDREHTDERVAVGAGQEGLAATAVHAQTEYNAAHKHTRRQVPSQAGQRQQGFAATGCAAPGTGHRAGESQRMLARASDQHSSALQHGVAAGQQGGTVTQQPPTMAADRIQVRAPASACAEQAPALAVASGFATSSDERLCSIVDSTEAAGMSMPGAVTASSAAGRSDHQGAAHITAPTRGGTPLAQGLHPAGDAPFPTAHASGAASVPASGEPSSTQQGQWLARVHHICTVLQQARDGHVEGAVTSRNLSPPLTGLSVMQMMRMYVQKRQRECASACSAALALALAAARVLRQFQSWKSTAFIQAQPALSMAHKCTTTCKKMA